VIATLVVFILVLTTISAIFSSGDQEHVIAEAATKLELIASVISGDINLRAAQSPNRPIAGVLAQALPLRALNHGQHVFLSNATGQIIASYPDSASTGSMSDHIGASSPLSILAEKAGVLRVQLPGGGEALATVHSLNEPMGQIAVIHPLSEILFDWHQTLLRTVIILCCTAGVISALACAYFWQASRARLADSLCHRVRNRIDSALSSGRCGLWDWDLAGGEVYWSNSMYEIMGMTPGNGPLSFSDINAMIHPEDGGLNTMIRMLSASCIESIDHVFRLRTAGNDWVWLRARAELVQDSHDVSQHLVGIAVDVTEKMLLEERTATADMRLRDAIETISEAFVVWDADNRLVMCNSKFQRFHNLPGSALVTGTAYSSVMAHSTTPVIQSQISLGEMQPKGARTFEAKLGDGRWLQINERRTKDGGYVSVGTDITALKRNEEQLIESERRLMNSVIDLRKSRQALETQAELLKDLAERYLEQKSEAESANRAKSDFLANMSHELRTPLNAILGFSEMMADQVLGPIGSPKYVDYCRDIHDSGQHLLNMISEVLDMARLEAGRIRLERTDFAVNDVIIGAMKSIEPLAAASEIDLRSEINGAGRLNADRAALEKILTILLNNAVKYTPRQGQITVRVRALQDSMNIYVEDTGVGIPAEALARLGRPFEQSHATMSNGMRGSGLGLAIARSLIDLHGGSLRIRSSAGHGTIIQVHLPNGLGTERPPLSFAPARMASREQALPPPAARLMTKKSVAKISATA
jgi:two-component system cell cycle sensor histidine kinase PleC